MVATNTLSFALPLTVTLARGKLRRNVGTLSLTVAASFAIAALPFAGAAATELWPAQVDARYTLKFNGIRVGHLGFVSRAGSKNYAIESTGEISVLFGAIRWTGTSHVSGAVEPTGPAPKAYAFEWKKNKKGGAISLGFADHTATQVSVEPPAGVGPEFIPLTDKHKSGVLDPMSAIMALTRADDGEPCKKRVHVFDGKQRFDIIFSPKRKTVIAPTRPSGLSSVGFVCRAMYEPIAGHRNNADQKAYADNRDAEVVMQRLAGTGFLIPHSVTVPTSWGNGSMVIDRVAITSAGAGKIVVID